MSSFTLREVRERTYKPKDSWWTVWLVDPLASRLVVVTANRTSITPNQLTIGALVLGLAAAGCFLMGEWPYLVAGAALFHLSFVLDCMDGKIARLKGTGSVFGSWLDYVFDRLRVLICAVALMGGQFLVTGNDLVIWGALGIVFTDMFRYLNSPQIKKVRLTMQESLAEVIRAAEQVAQESARERPEGAGTAAAPVGPSAPRAEEAPAVPAQSFAEAESSGGDALDRAEEAHSGELQQPFHRRFPWYVRLRDGLRARRIRPHLFSGIEFQMGTFIVAPLVGVFSVTGMLVTIAVSAGLMFCFELAIVYKLWLSTREFTAMVRGIEAGRAAEPGARAAGGAPVAANAPGVSVGSLSGGAE